MEVAEVKKEQMKNSIDLCNSGVPLATPDTDNSSHDAAHSVVSNVRERLQFSKYLVDPNKFRFSKVVRVIAFVIKTARNWLAKIRRNLTNFPLVNNKCQKVSSIQDEVMKVQMDDQIYVLSAPEVQYSLDYLFRK